MPSRSALHSVLVRAIPRRFSLRGLMLLVLVSGMALGNWRWPIEKKELSNVPQLIPQGLGPATLPEYEIRTYHRGWPGELVRHGLTTVYDDKDRKIGEEMWVEGVRHGPARRFDSTGYQYESRQYRTGKPHGRWESQGENYAFAEDLYECRIPPSARKLSLDYDSQGELVHAIEHALPGESCFRQVDRLDENTRVERIWTADGSQPLERVEFDDRHSETRNGRAQGWYVNGKPRYLGNWRDGSADGLWKHWDKAGRVHELLFAAGRLVRDADQPVTDYADLGAQFAQGGRGVIDRAECLETPLRTGKSRQFAPIDWNQFSLRKSPLRVYELARDLPAQIDRRVPHELRRSVLLEFPYDGIPAEAALYLALHPHGLAIEFRDEQLWITTREAARQWDRSPSLQLQSPQQSALANALDNRTTLTFCHDPLVDLVRKLERDHDIKIAISDSTDAAEPLSQRPVTLSVFDISLSAALATLCYLNDLDCEVRGEQLVITARRNQQVAERVP